MIMKMFATLDKAKPDTKNMRLKFGGGQPIDRSSEQSAIIAESIRNRA
jgi:hypothetical protein